MKSTTKLLLLVTLLGSCKSSNGTHDVATTDSTGDDNVVPPDTDKPLPSPYANLTWTVTQVDTGDATKRAGDQGKLLRGEDGTLYYAYFKAIGTTVNNCNIAKFSTSDPMPGTNFDLKVAILAPGATTWTIEKVPLEQVSTDVPYVTNRYGIDGAFNAAGNPVFAFAGGLPGVYNCGSTDLVTATRTGSNAWMVSDLVQDSSACCSYCVDPACLEGDIVGPWASMTADGSQQLAIAYMDYHFNTDHDGWAFRGLEMWQEGGAVSGIKPWSGKGTYSQLRYLPAHTGATFSGFMAAYTTPQASGLYVARQVATAGALTDWDEKALRPDSVGERLSLAVAPDGTVGLAFYSATNNLNQPTQDLVYCYSTDNGDHWSVPCETADQANTVGQYPSLAFDKESRALVSYYYCGAGGDCKPSGDGLRFAIRTGVGAWIRRNVSFDAANVTGVFSQLVVDPDTDSPTIVFQDVTRGFAMVARGNLNGGAQ